MKTRALLLAAVFVSLAASAASQPVKSGSTIVVTRADGTTMAIPSNLVLSVSTAARGRSIAATLAPPARIMSSTGAGKPITITGNLGGTGFASTLATGKSKATQMVTTATASALSPGQTLFIGQTGGAVSAASTTVVPNRGGATAGSPVTSADTMVVSPRSSSAFGQSGLGLASANPAATTIERQVFQGDLARDAGVALGSNTAVTGDFIIGPNGFPVPITVGVTTTAGGTVIGTNGFPATTPTAGQTEIGPNGFPVPVPTAQTVPQTAAPVIGSNGFPAVGSTGGPAVQTGLTRNIATVPSSISTGTIGSSTTGTAAVTTTNGTTGASRAAAPTTAASTTTGAAAGTSGSPQ